MIDQKMFEALASQSGARVVEHITSTIEVAQKIFEKKAHDYGTSWRLLRLISVADQMKIKADRIKNLSDMSEQKVRGIGDDIPSEFLGIINYGIIGLMQHRLGTAKTDDMPVPEAIELYKKTAQLIYTFAYLQPPLRIREILQLELDEVTTALQKNLRTLKLLYTKHVGCLENVSQEERVIGEKNFKTIFLNISRETILLSVLGFVRTRAV